ncbi:MAG: hypothetical protein IJ413_07980, partial [Bacteroides sp.]|nr:hypothetical protein [Bacteroides sp.]
LVGNLIGLAVADNPCHFLTCHHIIVVLPTKIGGPFQVSMTWLTGRLLTNTATNHYLLVITDLMTNIIQIG